MELKDLFTNSSNETYTQNEELLEEHDLLNIFGSPNKLFLKFLQSKKLDIMKDEITEELIEEFQGSKDSIKLKQVKIQRQKETIFNQRKVWINIEENDEWIGTDLILDHDSITIEKNKKKIPYEIIDDIEISEGGWAKNKFIITTEDEEIVFEINEEKAIPLKEIIEDNISNQKYDEIDELLELLSLFEDGKISEDEYEARKAIIYSDDVYCTNCGEKIDPDSEFCQHCGHKVEK